MKSKAFRFFSCLFFVGVLAVTVVLSLTSAFDLHAFRTLEIAFVTAFLCAVVGYVGFAVAGLYALFQPNKRYRQVAIVFGVTGAIIELILYKFDMEPMLLGYAFPLIVPVGLCLAIISLVVDLRQEKRMNALSTAALLANTLPLALTLFIALISAPT